MNPYRQRVWQQMRMLLDGLDVTPSVILDFGSGDGWFSLKMGEYYPGAEITSIDIKKREKLFLEPLLYEPGRPLPFEAASFELTYAVDVLHHCNSPEYYLDELVRVSRRYLLIKDHSWRSKWGFWALAVLDELGNRRFGIPSPQHYQYSSQWTEHLKARGWILRQLIDQCPCHSGVLGAMTNRLQYLALYERGEPRRE
jgi:ubiquinone/menaquinone biosynthesis C-methylase UbiE